MANKTELIRQALNAAESSIKLAKQLMTDLERSGNARPGGGGRGKEDKPSQDNLPGVIGVFDGENMVTDKGEKILVPANYAAKSQLLVGDTLKQVDINNEKRFKQIDHQKRLKTTGILTKKEGRLTVVAQEGRYRVLTAAVDHVGAKVGDELTIVIPENNLNAGWAAVDSLVKDQETETDEQPQKPMEVSKTDGNTKEKPIEPVLVKSNETKKDSLREELSEATQIEKLDSDTESAAEPEVKLEEIVNKEAADEPQLPVTETKTEESGTSTVTKAGSEEVLLTDEDLR